MTALVAVIGGGITGMASALRLRELAAGAGRAVRVTLIESGDRLGGKLRSERVDGYVVDLGADIFLASRPEAIGLCRTLGMESRLVGTNVRNRRTFVREDDALRPATHYGDEHLVTLAGGMQELADAAGAALDRTTVMLGTRAEVITPRSDGLMIHTTDGRLTVDAAVIAVPARPAASLLSALAPAAHEALGSMTHRSSFTVSAAFPAARVPHALDGYGYLVPGAGAGEVSACTWTSSKIPSRAPAGGVLLRGYVHGGDDVNAEHAQAVVLDEFRRVLGITAAPDFVRTHDWKDALPVLDAARAARADVARAAIEPVAGIALAGGAIDGIGISDGIRSGRAAADRVWSMISTQ